jgi:erythritol transport system substrate-binding protein
MIKTGKTGQPEKQSIDCELITKDNADDYGVFAKKTE